jgi:hypothetical protein
MYRSPDSGVKRWLPYVAGHRDANSTDCPGSYLYAALPAVRKQTAAVIGKGRADSSIRLDASTNDVTYPASVVLAGRLTKRSGKAIPFVHVRLYTRRTHHGWQEITLRTRADGSFRLPVPPRNKLKARAVFHGDRKVWGSQSTLERVLVTPKIEVHADGGVPDDSGVVHYPAGTTSVDLSGSLGPPHPGLRVRVRVSRYESDGSQVRLSSVWTHLDHAGHFGIEFKVPDPGTGTYRAVAMFPSDGDHTTARSQQALFAIDPAP